MHTPEYHERLLETLGIRCLGLSGSGITDNNALIGDILGVHFVQKKALPDALEQVYAFAGWGRKKSYARAAALAKKYAKPIITLEDGFLRSIDSGINSRYGLSFVADDLGIYFDAHAPSRLERLIANTRQHWQDTYAAQAERLINKLIHHKLSKYNATLDAPNLSAIAGNTAPHVLIIDQVKGDASIVGAGADQQSFFAMLTQARIRYPDANLWIKAHPAGKGYFRADMLPDTRFYLDAHANPIALLEQVDVVFTVSSHMGFEALMLSKCVHCFGVAWYSGFGLTIDDNAPSALLKQACARRLDTHPTPVSVSQLFYAAYLRYSYYGDPASCGVSQTACDIDTAMDWLIKNRNHALKMTGTVLSCELTRWKSGFVRQFIATPLNTLTIKPKSRWLGAMPDFIQARMNAHRHPYKNQSYRHVIAWGMQHSAHLKTTPAYQNTQVWCMEDGFIRSNGLGATLLAPLSVVLDRQGIYYNARHTCDLERTLSALSLDVQQRAEIRTLLDTLTRLRITKYNVGAPSDLSAQIHALNKKTPVHLVVGQVEDDASVQSCLSSITTNSALLSDVRRRYPDDLIIYKPHPDVEAGLRTGKVDEATLALADIVAQDTAMPDCLDVCQVVHTISSLTGFEALIRGRRVVCYGLPFYAGYQLTDDIHHTDPVHQAALARRKRKTPLDIETLAYATLIDYPLYRLPDGIGLASALQVANYLAKEQQNPSTPSQKTQLKRQLSTHFMQLRAALIARFKG